MTIRVCLVEDQTIVRHGLRGLLALNADFEVVAEASDGEEALEVIPRTQPDVILLDLRMPRLDGVGVLRALRERGMATPALILTTFDDDSMLFEAVRAGAKGWLLKDVSLERLTSAIRTVAGGGKGIEPVLHPRIVPLAALGTPPSALCSYSPFRISSAFARCFSAAARVSSRAALTCFAFAAGLSVLSIVSTM